MKRIGKGSYTSGKKASQRVCDSTVCMPNSLRQVAAFVVYEGIIDDDGSSWLTH